MITKIRIYIDIGSTSPYDPPRKRGPFHSLARIAAKGHGLPRLRRRVIWKGMMHFQYVPNLSTSRKPDVILVKIIHTL